MIGLSCPLVVKLSEHLLLRTEHWAVVQETWI